MPTSIFIENASFEANSVKDGKDEVSTPGWVTDDSGTDNPKGKDIDGGNIDGDNVAYIEDGGSISQTLSKTYSSNEVYRFDLFVGDEDDKNSGNVEYTINIKVGSTIIGTVSGSTGDIDALTAVSVNSSGFAGNPALNGQPLTIEIISTRDELFVDNVRGEFDVLANGIVEGSDTAETMNIGYVDAGGDIIDGADGLNDNIQGNEGDDVINAGFGNDVVDGGANDDTIDGGAGNDNLFGGASVTAPAAAPAPFQWSLIPDPDNGGVIDSGDSIGLGSQVAGSVTVDFDFRGTSSEFDTSTGYVAGIDANGQPVNANSSIGLENSGTSNVTFSEEVEGVSFRVNDFESNLETLRVIMFDSGGSRVAYTATLGSNVQGVSTGSPAGNDTFNGTQSANNASPSGSVLFNASGPVARIEFSYTNSGGTLALTDIFFDDPNPGEIVLEPGGDDSIDGGIGADTIDGGDGNDTLSGGVGDDVFLASTGSDTVTGDTGTDTYSAVGGQTASGTQITVDINDDGDGTVQKSVGGNDTLDGVENFVAAENGADTDTITLASVATVADVGGLDNNSMGTFTPDAGGPAVAFGDFGQPTLSDILGGGNGGPAGTFQITSGDEAGQIGNVTFENFETINFNVICFSAGTMISTINGERNISTLSIGDKVFTLDNNYQRIRWIGSTTLDKIDLVMTPKLKPIRIAAGALGAGLPEKDLTVSPQHRMLVRSIVAERMFGQQEVLVPAVKLLPLDGVEIVEEVESVTYWHMLFERHEIVVANGAPSESLFTGPEALKSVSPASRREILALFPDIAKQGYSPQPARLIPEKGKQMKALVARLNKNTKDVVEFI